MKRWMTIMIAFVAGALLLTSSARMQTQNQSSNRENHSELSMIENPRAGYISKSARHKLLIEPDLQQSAVYAELRRSQSLVEELDYGSFKVAVVDEYLAGGLERLQEMKAIIRDDMNLIRLGSYEMDTMVPEATLSQLPAELRQTDMADAMARGGQPKGGLYIVQFIGPIQEAWLAALDGTGAEVVSYLSANAYVVSANRRAAAKLMQLKHKRSYVQFLGDYEPAFRLSAGLEQARNQGDGHELTVTVRVSNGRQAAKSLARLQAIFGAFEYSEEQLNQQVVGLRVRPEQLADLAGVEGVLAIHERHDASDVKGAEGQMAVRTANRVGEGVYDEFLNKHQQPSPALQRAEEAIAAGREGGQSGSEPNERFVLDQTQRLTATGKTYHLSGRIRDVGKPTRIALAWTSPPSVAGNQGVVNNLDLEVQINGATYKGNVFAGGVSVSGGKADSFNSLETIILPAGMAGEFRLTVKAANLAGDGVPEQAGRTDQDFALVGTNLAACQPVWMNPNQFNLTRFEGIESTALESFIIRSTNSLQTRVAFTAAPSNFPVGVVSIVSCASCFTPDTVQFRSPAFVSYPAGTYRGYIEVVANGCLQLVPVDLAVVPPSVTLNPTSLSFTAAKGGPNPANKSFTISAGTNLVPWTVSSNASWLTVSPTSGTTAPSSTVSVGVNVAGLAAGTYLGVITVSLQSGGVLKTLPITLTVATPQISINPTSLSFSTGVGGANPSPKTVSINNVNAGGFNWTASDNQSWLQVSPTSGTAPSTLTVSINKVGLGVGTYSGTVTLTAAGASNSPLAIPVTLTITSSPVISVSPTSLTFAAREGITPPPKTVSLSNAGGGTLNWSVSSNASWLLVSPASGTGSATLTVSIDPSGLGVGTYQGSITITAPGASPVTIPVTFGVIEPLPGPQSATGKRVIHR